MRRRGLVSVRNLLVGRVKHRLRRIALRRLTAPIPAQTRTLSEEHAAKLNQFFCLRDTLSDQLGKIPLDSNGRQTVHENLAMLRERSLETLVVMAGDTGDDVAPIRHGCDSRPAP